MTRLLSEREESQLRTYHGLLLERALPMGLVSPGDRERLWERHVLDSLRALECLGDAGEIADVGSGAGLPGVVIAIARPRSHVTLVDAQSRRAAFLELVVERLSLTNVRVRHATAPLPDVAVDVVTARAVGSARKSWALGAPMLRAEGRLVYFAGVTWDLAEVPEGVRAAVCRPPDVDWQGPIIIMTA